MPWWQSCLCALRCTDPPSTILPRALNSQHFAPYLADYAEPEARALLAGSSQTADVLGPALERDDRWQGCLVVPAFDESLEALQQQIDALAATQVLLILVINAPQNASAEALARTQDLFRQVTAARHAHVIVVDRVSAPWRLNPKHGVGLARKIGTDLALALIEQGRIRSPWILQTDADVALPPTYTDLLHEASPQIPSGVKIFPHTHFSGDPTLHFAAQLYDQHMDYYVAGLRAAGSPYAHHSLGSTIAVHAVTYAAIRGYPRRSAGEDFYLLNKARKIAPIEALAEPLLTIQARLSERVPFGTGPALRDIVATLQSDPSGGSYLSYHPKCFEALGSAIRALDHWAKEPAVTLDADIDQRLSELGFDRFKKNLAKQPTTSAKRQQSVHDWFDGLKTLQFIHGMQSTWPDCPLQRTLAQSPEFSQSR